MPAPSSGGTGSLPAVRPDETSAFAPPPDRAALGTRIQVWGLSCSGKSTLAARLGAALDLPVVELDALNWRPGWVSVRETDRAAFDASVGDACSGPGWVVAGCYSGSSLPLIWPRLQTLVWLDLPRGLSVRRMCARTWRRWRSKELIWGQVHERFWPQFMVWRGEDSLLWWIWTQHARKRRQMHAWSADPRWAHVRFVRFTTVAAVERWVGALERERRASAASGSVPKRDRGRIHVETGPERAVDRIDVSGTDHRDALVRHRSSGTNP